jgi:hypothetical protein
MIGGIVIRKELFDDFGNWLDSTEVYFRIKFLLRAMFTHKELKDFAKRNWNKPFNTDVYIPSDAEIDYLTKGGYIRNIRGSKLFGEYVITEKGVKLLGILIDYKNRRWPKKE